MITCRGYAPASTLYSLMIGCPFTKPVALLLPFYVYRVGFDTCSKSPLSIVGRKQSIPPVSLIISDTVVGWWCGLLDSTRNRCIGIIAK